MVYHKRVEIGGIGYMDPREVLAMLYPIHPAATEIFCGMLVLINEDGIEAGMSIIELEQLRKMVKLCKIKPVVSHYDPVTGGGYLFFTSGDEGNEMLDQLKRQDEKGDFIIIPFEILAGGEEAKGVAVNANDDSTAQEVNPTCTICLKPILLRRDVTRFGEAGQMTICGHLFHHECLTGWTRTRMYCPNCMKRFDEDGYVSDGDDNQDDDDDDDEFDLDDLFEWRTDDEDNQTGDDEGDE